MPSFQKEQGIFTLVELSKTFDYLYCSLPKSTISVRILSISSKRLSTCLQNSSSRNFLFSLSNTHTARKAIIATTNAIQSNILVIPSIHLEYSYSFPVGILVKGLAVWGVECPIAALAVGAIHILFPLVLNHLV